MRMTEPTLHDLVLKYCRKQRKYAYCDLMADPINNERRKFTIHPSKVYNEKTPVRVLFSQGF